MAPCCRPSPRDKSCLRTGAKVPGGAGIPGCGREPPAVPTDLHVCRMDTPSPMALPGATGNSPVKKVLGRTHPPAKQHTSQSCSCACRAISPGKTLLPGAYSSRDQAKPSLFILAHEPIHLCTPSLSAPFWQPASQPSRERFPLHQQQLGSIHASIHPSICPGKGLNSRCLTLEASLGFQHGRERLTAGDHYWAARRRVEAFLPH